MKFNWIGLTGLHNSGVALNAAVRVLEDVWVPDAAGVAVPGACTGGSCHDDLPTLTVDRGPIAAWGFFHCLWTMADPPEVEMPELCLIHCWMMNFPILMGYAADRRKSLRPVVL